MIIADTHTLIWWINDPSVLSSAAQSAIESTDILGVSAITAWEIAMLHARQRIVIVEDPKEWLRDVFTLPEIKPIALSIDIAVTAASLRDPIRDPADRIIVATALELSVPLVTKDQKIRDSGIVETIW